MSRKVYKDNVYVLYNLLDIYTETDGIAGRIGIDRLVRHATLLTKALGNDYDKELLNKYKEENNITNYPTREDFTRDDVYGGIKDIEFMVDYLRESEDPLSSNFYEGLLGLLEPYSLVFNEFDKYEIKLNSEITDNDTQEEFSYEELVAKGQEPNYKVSDEDSDDYEPKTRAERRRKEENKL